MKQGCNSRFDRGTKRQRSGEKLVSLDRSSYHDEAGADWVVAAVAQFPIFGPVVLLTEELSILFIVPV